MSRRLTFITLLNLCSSGLICAVALAQADRCHMRDPNDPQVIQEAQESIVRGQNLIQQGRFEDAIIYFKRSQCLIPDLQNLIMIGALHAKTEDCQAAYLAWSQATVACGSCPQREEIRDKIERYTQQCTFPVQIITPNITADVYINQYKMGVTPYEAHILEGAEIRLKAPGYHEHIELLRSTTRSPIVRSLKPIQSRVVVRPTPPPLQVTPLPQSGLSPSTYQWSGDSVNSTAQAPRYQKLKYGLVAAGIGLAVSSLGLYIHSLNEYDELKKQLPNIRMRNDILYRQAQSAEEVYITSGVLVGFAATSLISSLILHYVDQ